MAYSGTTAATSLANPFRLTAGGGLYGGGPSISTNSSGLSTAPAAPNAQGAHVWSICSTNKTTDLASMEVTDGYELGMRPGDVVIATQFSSHGSSVVLSFNVVVTANSSAGTVTLGPAGSQITST